MWIEWLDGFIVSFLFTYIFTKGYQGRGIMEGLRSGFIIRTFRFHSDGLRNLHDYSHPLLSGAGVVLVRHSAGDFARRGGRGGL